MQKTKRYIVIMFFIILSVLLGMTFINVKADNNNTSSYNNQVEKNNTHEKNQQKSDAHFSASKRYVVLNDKSMSFNPGE
ncbi:hypothetical protein GSH19_05485 [Lactobacillus sp. S2-2]|uniref:hypothetical protein n=1 Tax=Lactobacillus sp. S2-2 TaxID=2692917 RepID=UPI001F44CD8C|nr:hypothetical protein [Lactobacillus sp. S2-2]MCF6515604.1 hypothetical protein [Lactobacillus sp. S2-2]